MSKHFTLAFIPCLLLAFSSASLAVPPFYPSNPYGQSSPNTTPSNPYNANASGRRIFYDDGSNPLYKPSKDTSKGTSNFTSPHPIRSWGYNVYNSPYSKVNPASQ